jgi:anti-sigma factor RsiW
MQDLEFTISQYLDGTLSPEQRQQLERHLETDAAGRQMLEEYRRLDGMIKSAMPMPGIAWEKLSGSISAAIDAHEERAAEAYRMPRWVRMSVWPMALAASLLIAAGLGIQLYSAHSTPKPWNNPLLGITHTPASPSSASSTLVAFQTDQAKGPAVEEVAIGPGAGFSPKNQSIAIGYASEPAALASHVTVVSGGAPVHDSVPASFLDMQ